MIQLKRVYEKASPDDGPRILVERLWPRGVKKSEAAIDFWFKEVAPSAELRKWFGHDPQRWEQFVRRYWAELQSNPAAIAELRRACRGGAATFVYAARDQEHNGANVLRRFLQDGSHSVSATASTGGGRHYTGPRSSS